MMDYSLNGVLYRETYILHMYFHGKYVAIVLGNIRVSNVKIQSSDYKKMTVHICLSNKDNRKSTNTLT